MFNSWQELQDEKCIIQLKETNNKISSIVSKEKIEIPKFDDMVNLNWLDKAMLRSSSRFTLIVIGQVSSGKSAFINSLFGRKLFLTKDTPTDGTVSVLYPTKISEEYAEIILIDGSTVRFDSIEQGKRFIRQDETPIEEQLKCKEVRFYLDEPWLNNIRVVNTPGLGDRMKAFEQTTLNYLNDDESDLIIWTFFPDTAANKFELGVFSDILSRRRKSIIGIVTRSYEGHEYDTNYDPLQDEGLIGPDGILQSLKNYLGEYLSDIIIYDSHKVRKLVNEMKSNPNLETEPEFIRQLESTGYKSFRNALEKHLGSNNQDLQKAQIMLFLKKCQGHIFNLNMASTNLEQFLQQKSENIKQDLNIWNKFEADTIIPWKDRFKNKLSDLAKERSNELIIHLGDASADAIQDNFTLLSTLWRSLISWTKICDPMTDKLNKDMEKAINLKLINSKFHERMENVLKGMIEENLNELLIQLKNKAKSIDFDVNKIEPELRTSGSNTTEIMGDALSAALKPVISAILKQIAKALEEKATEQAIKEATKKAGTEAAEQLATKTGGATAAKVLGIATLILVPFDIEKLVKDFDKGKGRLIDLIHAKYKADRLLYEIKIFEAFWEISNKIIIKIINEAREDSTTLKTEHSKYLKYILDINECKESLKNLNQIFSHLIND